MDPRPSAAQATLTPFALAVAGVLLLWSGVGNLVLGEWAYVPRNLALTGLLLWAAARAGVTTDELGLGRGRLPAGVRAGAWAVAVVAVALLVAVPLRDHLPLVAALLEDRRAALPGPEVAYHALVRIPVGTALFEEVAFRGVLLAAAARSVSTWAAVVWTSAVFGVWHVPPTIVALEVNAIPPVSAEGLAALAGAVAVTTVAGVAFCWLRVVSGSLVAPILAHWATNALGLLAAASITSP
jgi:membrane protease YdiL (CAAX protease family)